MWPLNLDYSKQECVGILRGLELKAYSHVLDALRAGGPLTQEKSSLLADLRKNLNISEDRHKAEVRRAVNSEVLNTICERLCGPDECDDWKLEGRRIIPLLPRAAPITGYTPIANKAREDLLSLNKELPPPWDTRSVSPLPPLQREVKTPDHHHEDEFVKPEPVTPLSVSAANQNGSLGGSHQEKIKTEIKEEVLAAEDETGMVFLPSGMAVRLSSEEKPAGGGGGAGKKGGGGSSGAGGKRKRSVSKSIEVFPKGVPVAASSPARGGGAGRRGSTSSPPRKYTSPLSPVHQAGHGYARPPPPQTTASAANDASSVVDSLPQSPSAVTAATALQQLTSAAMALDLAQQQQQQQAGHSTVPVQQGKRGPGRPPGASSPSSRGSSASGGGVRTRGARAPRVRGSRSRGRGGGGVTRGGHASAATTTTTATNLQQVVYAAAQQQAQQPQQEVQHASIQQQQHIVVQQQQQQQQQQASLYTALNPVMTALKGTSTSRGTGTLYSRETLNHLMNTSNNSTNPVSLAHYISTTPTKALNLAKTSTILTPVAATTTAAVVRALHSVKPGSTPQPQQQQPPPQQQQLVHMRQQASNLSQQVKVTPTAAHQHQPQQHPPSLPQVQSVTPHHHQYLSAHHQVVVKPEVSREQQEAGKLTNDLNGRNESSANSLAGVNNVTIVSEGSNSSSGTAVNLTEPTLTAAPIVSKSSVCVTTSINSAGLISMGLPGTGGANPAGVKLLHSAAKIVPKSGGGPVYFVRNSGQRVLNQRVVTVPGGGTALVSAGGGTAGGTALVTAGGGATLRPTTPGMPTVIRNIRTTTANSKSVIVVKPAVGGALATATALRGAGLTAVAAHPGPGSVGGTEIVLRGAGGANLLRAPVAARVASARPATAVLRQQSNGGVSTTGSSSISSTATSLNAVGSGMAAPGGTLAISSASLPSSNASGIAGNSSGNMFLLDLSQDSASSTITLNNADPIVQRVKPVLATKQLAGGNKAVGSKIYITNSTFEGAVGGTKNSNIYLQQSKNDQPHLSGTILNKVNTAGLHATKLNSLGNSEALPQNKVGVVSSLANRMTAAVSGLQSKHLQQVTNNVEEDQNYSDIFSRALEQANIPVDSPLPAELDLAPKHHAGSNNGGFAAVIGSNNGTSGGRSVTLQSRGRHPSNSSSVALVAADAPSPVPNAGSGGGGPSSAAVCVSAGGLAAAGNGASSNNTDGSIVLPMVDSLDSIPDQILQPNSWNLTFSMINNNDVT